MPGGKLAAQTAGVPAHSLAHLLGRHHLVCQGQQPRLRIPGPGGQREHVAGDGGALTLVQTEHPARPVGGVGAVDKGVHVLDPGPAGETAHVAAVVVPLPVIAKKVVEQRGAGQGPYPVLLQMEPPGQPVGALRRGYGVDVKGVLSRGGGSPSSG